MTPEEIKVSIRAMLDRETDIATLQDVWMPLIEHLGEYKDLGHCECCGGIGFLIILWKYELC